MEQISTKIQNAVREELDLKPFSGVISVQMQGRILYEEAFGLANRSDSIPNTPATRFGVASGSKIFTAVAIGQLVQQGLLTYDSRLCDCVDVPFPNFDKAITLAHLLTHTSGITSYFEEEKNDDYEALWEEVPVYAMRSPADFLPLFQHKQQKFPPGDHFEYNDGGFILLGLIIEQVSDMAFPDYVRSHVFEPAGMSNSGYFRTDRLPERCAAGYIEEGDSWRSNIYAVPFIGAPDGGAYTTAEDMCRFWNALQDNRLLDEPRTRLMMHPHVQAEGEGEGVWYGYGVWVKTEEPGGNANYVEGWDPGVACMSSIWPHEDLKITILGNTNRSVWSLYRAVRKGLTG
ncbi:MAG: beta-lactamase family protein [Anaerolineales bacterium]|nr:beta-lactamase family protein [Anaerolineales bacterium]